MAPFGARGTQVEDQPPKDDPFAGTAVRVTTVPELKDAVHPEPVPQLMLPTEEVMVPVPAPVLYTDNVGRLTVPPVATTASELVAAVTEPLGEVRSAVMAVIDWEPTAATPVARPEALMVATDVSLETHWTVFVRSCTVLDPTAFPIARN